MPPIRSYPTTKSLVAPVKSERSHSENQERAYIAASRRSDRSLEARVESARRASEVHKERTGRSLKVTEEDVLNEEMYEEEDDDLPLQYRRLTAHLHTSSAAFNRRLAAYLTNHVAIRDYLGEAMQNQGNNNQYSNMPPSQDQWWNSAGQPFSQPTYPMQSPSMAPMSPSSYRQSPYPSPFAQGLPQQNLHRSSSASSHQGSIHSPQTLAAQGKSEDHTTSQKPEGSDSAADRQPKLKAKPREGAKTSASASPTGNAQTEGRQQQTSVDSSQSRPVFSASDYHMSQQANFNPFSMALPLEAQTFFPPYNSNNPASFHDQQDHVGLPSKLGGMSQTLAPSVLDKSRGMPGNMHSNFSTFSHGDFNLSDDPSAPSNGFDFELNQNYGDCDDYSSFEGKNLGENFASDEFIDFINTDGWDDNSLTPLS